jgi:hypothetical protein
MSTPKFQTRLKTMVQTSFQQMLLARKAEKDHADQVKDIVEGTITDKTLIQQVLAKEKQILLQAVGFPPDMTSIAGKRLRQLQENEDTNSKTALGKSNEHYQRREQQFTDQVAQQAERLIVDIQKVALSLAKDAPKDKAFDPSIRDAITKKSFAVLKTSAPTGIPHHAAAATTAPLPHAEMQILDYLIARNGPTIAKSPEDIPLYIGVTKLCCQDCHASIQALNQITRAVSVVETAEDSLETRGTHLKAYNTWTPPSFIATSPDLHAKYLQNKDALAVAARTMTRKEEADKSESDPSTTPPREGSFDALTKDAEVLHQAVAAAATPSDTKDPKKPKTLREQNHSLIRHNSLELF